MIKAIKQGEDHPPWTSFEELADRHIEEVLFFNLSLSSFSISSLNIYQAFGDENELAEENLILTVLLVTSMNQYDAAKILSQSFDDGKGNTMLYKLKKILTILNSIRCGMR